MKKSKPVFLFIILLVPVIIVLFLKNFGNNRFDVPMYHQEPTDRSGVCENEMKAPYKVDVPTQLKKENQLTLFLFPGSVLNSENRMQYIRICEKIKDKPIQLIVVNKDEWFLKDCPSVKNFSPENLEDWERCVLLMEAKKNMVLLDGRNVIRGYYRAEDRGEVDRMAVEVEILIQNDEYISR